MQERERFGLSKLVLESIYNLWELEYLGQAKIVEQEISNRKSNINGKLEKGDDKPDQKQLL